MAGVEKKWPRDDTNHLLASSEERYRLEPYLHKKTRATYAVVSTLCHIVYICNSKTDME